MSAEATGSSKGWGWGLGWGEVGEVGAQLIITPIHLRWTPARLYDGASQRRRTFDESPFLNEESPADREASISPRAAIHHLIRTAGCSAQTGGLPESREEDERGGGGEAAPAPSQPNHC